MQLKNYDPNLTWAKHTMKISFMMWDYKGHVTYEMGGNARGISLLAVDPLDLYETTFDENPVNFRNLGEAWFAMDLTNEKGDITRVEDDFKSLGDYIVAVEIIAHEPEN